MKFAKDVAKTSAEAKMLPKLMWHASEHEPGVNVRDEIVRGYEEREKAELTKKFSEEKEVNEAGSSSGRKNWSLSLFRRKEEGISLETSGHEQDLKNPPTSLTLSSVNASSSARNFSHVEENTAEIHANENLPPHKSLKEKIAETLKNVKARVKHCSCVRGD